TRGGAGGVARRVGGARPRVASAVYGGKRNVPPVISRREEKNGKKASFGNGVGRAPGGARPTRGADAAGRDRRYDGRSRLLRLRFLQRAAVRRGLVVPAGAVVEPHQPLRGLCQANPAGRRHHTRVPRDSLLTLAH